MANNNHERNARNMNRFFQGTAAAALEAHVDSVAKQTKSIVNRNVENSKSVSARVKVIKQRQKLRAAVEAQFTETKKKTSSGGIIDMKKAFAMSPLRKTFHRYDKKKKRTISGWYMDVPIRRKTYVAAKKDYSSYMTKGLYNQLLKADHGSIKVNPDLLYAARNNKLSDTIEELNYKPKGDTIMRVADERRKNSSTYVAIRRVSSESSPSSWIINRKNARREDPEVQRILRELQQVGR